MNSKTNTYLIVAGSIAVLALCGHVYASYYVSGLTEKTTALRTEVQLQEIKVRSAQIQSKSAENTSEERKTLAGFFVQSGKAIDFITMVERSAAALSLAYSTNQIESADAESLSSQNKELLRMSMTISGNWRNVLRFLKYIETLPYAVDVQKVELSSDQGGAAVQASAGGSTTPSVARGGNWRLGITFAVVKIKDNAR